MNLNILPKILGFILYEGKSSIDSKPIVCIGTLKTDNPKTGNMIQTWIIRSDINPIEAIYNGEDYSVCGDCKHRGDNGRDRSCYVVVGQAVGRVYRAYKNNKYSVLSDEVLNKVTRNRMIRLGAYGNISAIPYEITSKLVENSLGYTGYVHNYLTCDQRFRNICMASVDSDTEYLSAKALGWRAFRVRGSDEPLLKGEFSCPASEEAGHRLTCENCLACSGTRFGRVGGGDVSIIVHGRTSMKKSFNNRRASE